MRLLTSEYDATIDRLVDTYTDIPMSACSADRTESIIGIWQERLPQSPDGGLNPVLLNAKVLCPDETNLSLEGYRVFETNYRAIVVDYEYCFEHNPLSQCMNETDMNFFLDQDLLLLFVQSEF